MMISHDTRVHITEQYVLYIGMERGIGTDSKNNLSLLTQTNEKLGEARRSTDKNVLTQTKRETRNFDKRI